MKYHGVCVKVQNPGYFEEADRLSDRPIGKRKQCETSFGVSNLFCFRCDVSCPWREESVHNVHSVHNIQEFKQVYWGC